jgi:hypothetical protein
MQQCMRNNVTPRSAANKVESYESTFSSKLSIVVYCVHRRTPFVADHSMYHYSIFDSILQ